MSVRLFLTVPNAHPDCLSRAGGAVLSQRIITVEEISMFRLEQVEEARTRDQHRADIRWKEPDRANGEPGCSHNNELIRSLSPQSQRILLRHCEMIRLLPRQMLQARGVELRFAYFIESGSASLTTRARDCPPVEIRTLGRRDFVGVPLVLGTRLSPHQCTVQVSGKALRLAADDFIHLLRTNVELEKLLLGYVQAALIHSSQLVACNSRHNLTQRLARWLLVARDSLGSDEICVTHRAIAQSLAVRRAGITTTIGEMEQAGMIRRSRGRTVIVDEGKLEAASCDCHRVIRSAQERSLVGMAHS
jgi:CRP-like cAMP-binding protein